MQRVVNGETMTRPDGESLAGLLQALSADGGRVAVLVNDEVVPPAQRTGRTLREGDRVELLTFAGGG